LDDHYSSQYYYDIYNLELGNDQNKNKKNGMLKKKTKIDDLKKIYEKFKRSIT